MRSLTQRLLLAGALVLPIAAIAAVAIAPGAALADDIETPEFETLAEEGAIQLRRYEPMLMAQVTVEANDAREAAQGAFMRLAKFIFGGNDGQQKIEMTAPVLSGANIPSDSPTSTSVSRADGGSLEGAGAYTVAFTMPSQWTRENLPAPNDDAVTFATYPGGTMAAWSYVGRETVKVRREGEAKLRAWLKSQPYAVTGPAIWAGYSGPMTPSWKKRWEVLLPVKAK